MNSICSSLIIFDPFHAWISKIQNHIFKIFLVLNKWIMLLTVLNVCYFKGVEHHAWTKVKEQLLNHFILTKPDNGYKQYVVTV